MKNIMRGLLLVGCLLSVVSAFGESTTGEGFRASAGGLKIKDVELGQGLAATQGDVATIHFITWIDNEGKRGREVFNSRKEGRPVSFVIGSEGVMEGWNEGVMGMTQGGHRLLLIPPAMAYGDRDIEDIIPANSTLLFHVELVKMESRH